MELWSFFGFIIISIYIALYSFQKLYTLLINYFMPHEWGSEYDYTHFIDEHAELWGAETNCRRAPSKPRQKMGCPGEPVAPVLAFVPLLRSSRQVW